MMLFNFFLQMSISVPSSHDSSFQKVSRTHLVHSSVKMCSCLKRRLVVGVLQLLHKSGRGLVSQVMFMKKQSGVDFQAILFTLDKSRCLSDYLPLLSESSMEAPASRDHLFVPGLSRFVA